MTCPEAEQQRVGCAFSTILRDAVDDCGEVQTSLCPGCTTVIMVTSLLTGAAHIHHSAGVPVDFIEIARKVYGAVLQDDNQHLDS